jgi:hypothetical protein
VKSGLLILALSVGLFAAGSAAWAQELPDAVGPENLGVRVPLLLSSTFLTAVNTIELTTGDGSRILGLLGVLSGAATIWAETEATDGKAWVWSVGVASLFTGAMNLWHGGSDQQSAAMMMGRVTPVVLVERGVGATGGVMTIVRF